MKNKNKVMMCGFQRDCQYALCVLNFFTRKSIVFPNAKTFWAVRRGYRCIYFLRVPRAFVVKDLVGSKPASRETRNITGNFFEHRSFYFLVQKQENDE